MKRLICLSILMLALTACGPKVTATGFQAKIDGYKGQPVETLIADWGPPANTYTDGRGQQEFLFTSALCARTYPNFQTRDSSGPKARHRRLELFSSAPTDCPPAARCDALVSTNTKGHITNIAYRGPGCRAPEAGR